MTEDEIMKLEFGDVFFCEGPQEFCCVVKPNDVDFGSDWVMMSLSRQDKILLFLDAGRAQYGRLSE